MMIVESVKPCIPLFKRLEMVIFAEDISQMMQVNAQTGHENFCVTNEQLVTLLSIAE